MNITRRQFSLSALGASIASLFGWKVQSKEPKFLGSMLIVDQIINGVSNPRYIFAAQDSTFYKYGHHRAVETPAILRTEKEGPWNAGSYRPIVLKDLNGREYLECILQDFIEHGDKCGWKVSGHIISIWDI